MFLLVHVREGAHPAARTIRWLGCSVMRSWVACPRQGTWHCGNLTSCTGWSVIPRASVIMALLRVTRVVTRACQMSLRGLRWGGMCGRACRTRPLASVLFVRALCSGLVMNAELGSAPVL